MSDGDLIFLPSEEGLPHPLGRSVVWHDPQNRRYRALESPVPRERPPVSRPWYTTDVYNQLGSSCAAAAAVGTLRTSPFRGLVGRSWPDYDSEQDRFNLYRQAQRVDPWRGEEPTYEGTSTDAPFRVLRDRGVIPGWRWIFGLDELRDWVRYRGPAVVGTNWYDSMFNVGRDGHIRISPGAQVVGGHAWRIAYYDVDDRRFRKVGSWGRDWGEAGRAWVDEATMERLLHEQGEAATVALP